MIIIVSTSLIYGEDKMKRWKRNDGHKMFGAQSGTQQTFKRKLVSSARLHCQQVLAVLTRKAQNERERYEQLGEKARLTAWDFWFEGTTKIFWICIIAAMLRISWEQPKFPIKQKTCLISIIQCVNEKWKAFSNIFLAPYCKLKSYYLHIVWFVKVCNI